MELSKINETQNIQKKGENAPKTSFSQKTAPMPNDSVELSTKGKSAEKNFLNVAAFLAAAAAVVGGGTYGGVKIYNKYFQKLASGIKRGEINDALFDFIKRVDPKGKLFNNKKEIVDINNKFTDDNFLILKKLSKMKSDNPYLIISKHRTNNRFNLTEISELLQNTTEQNIKFLQQLAEKSSDLYGQKRFMKSDEIIKVLKEINTENTNIADKLINRSNLREIGKNDIETLINVLKSINKKNNDYYSLLLSTRQKGGMTELNLNEIQNLAQKLTETKNPKVAEVLLNGAKKGTGTYRFSTESIVQNLGEFKEENSELYKKLMDLDINPNEEDLLQLCKHATQDNVELIEPMLNKTYMPTWDSEHKSHLLFDNYDEILAVLNNTNATNKDITRKLVDICDNSWVHYASKYESDTKILPNFINQLNTETQIKKAEEILQNGIVDDKQTLTFKQFYAKFSGESQF